MNSATSHLSEIIRVYNELNSAVRTLQEADPLRHIREQMKLIQQADPFRELREQIKLIQQADPLKEVRELMKSVEQADPLKEIRDTIKYLNNENIFSNIKTAIQTYQRSNSFQELQQIYKLIQSQNIDIHECLKQSYPTSTLEEAYKDILYKFTIASAAVNEDSEQTIGSLIIDVESDLHRSPPSVLSLEFYLSTLIALIMLIYSQQMSDKSEERLAAKMSVMCDMISTLAEQIEESEFRSFYVVERPTRLLLRPNMRSQVVAPNLYPNQKVRLIERKGKWVRIEYFNHISNIHENGWCLKKYLKLCKVKYK